MRYPGRMGNLDFRNFISSIARSGFANIGLELRRARPTHEDFPRLAHFLKERGVKTVLDVGANKGQFAKDLFAESYAGSIISFEPIPELHPLLKAEAQAFGDRWKINPPVALSDQAGEHSFTVTKNLASSSLLPVLEASVQAAPESARAQTIMVRTERLDDIYSTLDVVDPVFLKIDTQGSEPAVLDGAETILRNLIGVKLELSLMLLYEGQDLAYVLDDRLRRAGFECWDVVPGFRNRMTGRLLQYDAVYFRA